MSQNLKFELNINKRSKKCWHLFLKPQRRPIWIRKGDIPMAQIYGEVIVNHPNRLQLKFEDCFRRGVLVVSRCIFVLIMALLGDISTAATKKLDFKNSHLTSVRAYKAAAPKSTADQKSMQLQLLHRISEANSPFKTASQTITISGFRLRGEASELSRCAS